MTIWRYRQPAAAMPLTIVLGLCWRCGMIFTSESGLLDKGRIAQWDEWYRGHLAAMVAVPGITSAQRFRALDEGPPPSLAMYTVASPAVFDSDIYLRTRGMGPFLPFVDRTLHRRNLFEGLEAAPDVPMSAVLLVADRSEPGPAADGFVWLRAIAIDCSVPYRAIVVFPGLSAAREKAARLGRAVALYAPMTERFDASPRANLQDDNGASPD
jgi:hypothetical protein